MRKIKHTSAFKRDVRREKRGVYREIFDTELEDVINTLANDAALDKKYVDHNLHYNFEGYRECHIRADLILLYRKTDKEIRVLRLERLGSHRQVLGIE